MDFEVTYTPEQEQFRQEVRAWFEEAVTPDLTQKTKSHEESEELYLRRRTFGRKLGEKGWLYPSAPLEYGGGGLDVDHTVVLLEEAARQGLSLPPYYSSGGTLGAASILVWGSDEQRERFLRPIYTGEVAAWQLLTEPEAGSDLAGVRTLALRDGDDYVLKGQKIFIGSEHLPEWFWILACTDPEGERHKNLSWFMIDASLPGITVQPMDLLGSGEGSGDTGRKNTIYLDDVRVPAAALVGGVNNGWQVASTHLELEHGGGGGIGMRNRFWDRLLDYCRKTEQDGRPLTADPCVRDLLAEIYIKTEVSRLFDLRNFWLAHARQPRSYEGSQSSLYRKLSGLWTTAAVLEAVGPAALTSDETWGSTDAFLEEQQRNGIVAVHPGGTADIQKITMARRIGIGRAMREEAGIVG